MLVSEYVDIKLQCNISRYLSLGYVFQTYRHGKRVSAKRGTTIRVAVTDLPKGSDAIIEYACDVCGSIKKTKYSSYLKFLREDGTSRCFLCKNGKPLYLDEWAQRNDVDIYAIWGTKNDCQPCDTTTGMRKKIWLKCLSTKYHDEYEIRCGAFANGYRGCPYCSHRRTHPNNSVACQCPEIIDYWSEKNLKSPYEYSVQSSKKVWMKCSKNTNHPDYIVGIGHFVNGSRCPYCISRKVFKEDSIGSAYPEIVSLWSSLNSLSPFDISVGSQKKIWLKCENRIHADHLGVTKAIVKSKFRCPECSATRAQSLLQEKVSDYLTGRGYIVLHEQNCNIRPVNPRTNRHMRYDNEVVELKLIVEVHGNQHYSPKWFHHYSKDPDQSLADQQYRDAYKKQYALDHGYHYLEIPYWTDDKNESWKQLIGNKILEIQKENT